MRTIPRSRRIRNMATKLYIGNLSFDTTESDLRETFAAFGDVASCNVITDRDTGRPRGFAFVEMVSADAANKAIAEMNGKELGGRALVVNEARPAKTAPRRRYRRRLWRRRASAADAATLLKSASPAQRRGMPRHSPPPEASRPRFAPHRVRPASIRIWCGDSMRPAVGWLPR